jgi:hypothetical protein
MVWNFRSASPHPEEDKPRRHGGHGEEEEKKSEQKLNMDAQNCQDKDASFSLSILRIHV